VIEVICAWCGKRVGFKEGKIDGAPPVSHSICESCAETTLSEFKALKKTKKMGKGLELSEQSNE
jgi:hypothetical protein